MGVEFEKERVYLTNLNACLDVIGYYYQECRVLELGIYTTSTDEKKYEYPVGIKGRENLRFKHMEYFETWGFKLTDYCLRTMRQRIKKLLGEEGVEPSNWNILVREAVVRQPGYFTSEGREKFTPPQEEPVKPVILRRAKIRAEFNYLNKDAEKILPALPALKFDKIKFSSASISADQVCQNVRIYRGNGIKTNLLSSNSDFIPARALLRYAQERNKEAGARVRIPPTESMTDLEITVSNKKPEIPVPKPSLSKRLGSPRGEREKGEVAQDVRREDREVEVIAELKIAKDRKEARASAQSRSVEKARASERLELDSSFEKPVKKKNKKKIESTSSSSDSSSSDSENDDGEPVTKDLVRMQALKVEMEVSKLMKLKEKYRKQKKLLRKQKK
jgi:hypothetical protein